MVSLRILIVMLATWWPALAQPQLRGNTVPKVSLASADSSEWSGRIQFDSQCLGIEPRSDFGYAVLAQDCEDGKASQNWVGEDGKIRLNSCPDCVESLPPQGLCWGLSRVANIYFAKGQVVLYACDSDQAQEFSIHLQDSPPPEAHGQHHIHSNGKCVKAFGDAVSGFVLELDECDYNYETNERELFGVAASGAQKKLTDVKTGAALSSHGSDWSGRLLFGEQCLGIDPNSDFGYAVLPQDCGEGPPSQYWVGEDGKIRLNSCPDCVESLPPQGLCWGLSRVANIYFAKGQVVLYACDSDQAQEFSIHLQDSPPPEAHGQHHIHSNGKCVKAFGDAVSGFVLELDECDYNYEANARQLFAVEKI